MGGLDVRQQLLVAREAYVRCESASPIPGRLRSVGVLSARVARVVVPGWRDESVPSVVAAFRLTFAPRPGHAPVVVRVRAHAIRDAGRWAWMLPAERLALHASGSCGVPAPVGDPRLSM